MFDLTTFSPYKQAVLILGVGLLVMLVNKGLQLAAITELNPEKIWVLAATFGLFFSVANCLFSLNAKETDKYWTQSMLAFAGVMGGLGLAAYFISGLGINEASSFRWIFIVVVIGYLVFSSIVRLMKNIVDFAQKEEWNQPKKKK